MLNRRYLRIKVMQALYAFFQGSGHDIEKGEKEMFASFEKLYELYHLMLLLLVEIKFHAERLLEESKNKKLPTQEDLSPNTKLIDNQVLTLLESDKKLKKFCENHGLSWQTEGGFIRKIFNNIRASQSYADYKNLPGQSLNSDRNFVITVYKEQVCDHDLVENFLEEKNIFWFNDFDYANSVVLKTLENIRSKKEDNNWLMPLYRNKEEDHAFASELFRRTVLHDEENQKLISEKTKNWELERIAMVDILLMKMAITELLYFPTIPVKVTLNEYIEISKTFSSPKSKVFINGVLDKLVIDFRSSGRIQKTGRGLLE